MKKSFVIFLLVVVVFAFLSYSFSSALYADWTFGLAGMFVGEDHEIKSGFSFPVSVRLWDFNNWKLPLASAASFMPVTPQVFKGLPFEVSIMISGIKKLLGVDLDLNDLFMDVVAKSPEDENEIKKDEWRQMCPYSNDVGTRRFSYLGNTKDIPWGPATFIFNLRHKDDKSIGRFLIFKWESHKEGTIQTPWSMVIQEPPPEVEKMSREEQFLYLRGFVPAWATPSDPQAAAQFIQQRRMQEQAEKEQQMQEAYQQPAKVVQIPRIQAQDNISKSRLVPVIISLPESQTQGEILVRTSNRTDEKISRVVIDGDKFTLVSQDGKESRGKVMRPGVVRISFCRGIFISVKKAGDAGWPDGQVISGAMSINL